MTLTSEKTASKRHAWLVGATTAAMAVALIGVGPIAANAAGATGAGTLAFNVAAQSAPTADALTSVDGTTDTSNVVITLANGAVFVANVTQPSTVAGLPANNVTSKFTFSQGDSTATPSAGNNVEVVTKGAAAGSNYTLTLTPAGYADSAVTGSVSQSITVDDNGNIFLGTQEAQGDASPSSFTVKAVKVTLGALTDTDDADVTDAAVSGNGANLTGQEAGDSFWVPAGASYTLSAGEQTPALASADAPFSNNATTGTKLSSPSAATILYQIAVPASASAPITTPALKEAVWSAPTVSPFNDVTTSTQFYKEMSWLSATGVSTGYADGGFHPAATIKRNAEAAFLYRLAGSPQVTKAQLSTTFKAFSDVKANTQFADAIAWLYTNGITTGYADGTFRPAAEVTRGAMAAFLYRFVNNDTTDTGTGNPTVAKGGVAVTVKAGTAFTGFSDVFGATQFSGEIFWLSSTYDNAGDPIATGYADGSFKPGASIKRNAMAAFIYRLVDVTSVV